MSKTYFVTRHEGAREWLARNHPELATSVEMVAHMNDATIEALQPGDVVIGVLPVPLAAKVCQRGARFISLEMEVPPEARGRELTASEMEDFGARLVEYHIERV